ncbi:MAG: TPM domain-containing protein [Candidatus Aenigmatarchaeota archaeon]
MDAKSLFLVTVFIAFLSFSQCLMHQASAQQFPDYQDDYVNDFAGIFTGEQASYLRSVLTQVRENTTAQVVIVTVDTVAPLEPSQYATELFTRWGIGKEDQDNGLLILYAKEEGKIWVTTGYGMEGLLPDSKIGRMLDDYYVPERDAGNVTLGIVRFTEEVATLINENPEWDGASGTGFPDDLPPVLYLFIPILAIFMISPLTFILVIFGLIVVVARRFGPRCEKDGARMKSVGSEGSYTVYECPVCHARKKKRRASSYAYAGGFAGGGFGGGGFGGGGFGGGGTGGGGAGR